MVFQLKRKEASAHSVDTISSRSLRLLFLSFAFLAIQNKMRSVISFATHSKRFRTCLSSSSSSIGRLSPFTISSSSLAKNSIRRSRIPASRLFVSSTVNKGGSITIGSGSNIDEPIEDVSQERKNMILETPLFKSSPSLLDGLDTYIINAEDGHPISLYGIHSKDLDGEHEMSTRRPILMLHGRTWSSVPVYHLLGGENKNNSHHSRSLMESLYDAGLQPYAIDFRGFGGTPNDDTNTVVPNRCVMDTECALEYIRKKHHSGDHKNYLPALMGWSQGALVAQLLAQKSPKMISKLILYGSIYDPMVRYPRQPLFVNGTEAEGNEEIKNTFNGAIEDFTVEGTIPPDAAIEFAEAALSSDPIKARWNYLCQFNNCDPARIHVPTLIVAGDQDPYAPLRVQSELFTNLGRGADRTWSIIADADHAVHMLDGGKDRFLSIVKSFTDNGKKGECTDFYVQGQKKN